MAGRRRVARIPAVAAILLNVRRVSSSDPTGAGARAAAGPRRLERGRYPLSTTRARRAAPSGRHPPKPLWVAAVPERMSSIPAAYHDLFERRTFAHLSTVMPDGTPHSTPVWNDYDADRMLVNTARGRRKERNVRETPAVGVSMCDPLSVRLGAR